MEAARGSDDEVILAGPLEIRPRDSLAVAGGRVLPLSVREYGVLTALARRAGRIVAREELFAVVWGGSLRAGDRSVDVYVHKVRTKLEDALPNWRFIHTHVGFGYRLSSEPSHAFHIRATAR